MQFFFINCTILREILCYMANLVTSRYTYTIVMTKLRTIKIRPVKKVASPSCLASLELLSAPSRSPRATASLVATLFQIANAPIGQQQKMVDRMLKMSQSLGGLVSGGTPRGATYTTPPCRRTQIVTFDLNIFYSEEMIRQGIERDIALSSNI